LKCIKFEGHALHVYELYTCNIIIYIVFVTYKSFFMLILKHFPGNPGFASFGEEMDYPLFYICPVVEMSSKPMIPTYNFEICNGPNPRRHNFYLLSDVLAALNMHEGELKQHCSKIRALQIPVGDILRQLENPHYNRSPVLAVPFQNLPKDVCVKFLPLCSELRRVMDIEVDYLDD